MHVTVRPDRLVAGGDAMARDVDGRIVFVRGALPGEEVDVEVETAKKDFAKGVVVDVRDPSSDRIEPQCHHRRNGCGGCGWMHIEPDAQLEAKTEIVRESLRRIGRLSPEVVDGLVDMGAAVHPFRYRTTIRVVGGPDGGLGFREEASGTVVPINSCDVADRALSDILPELSIAPGVEVTLRTSLATGALTVRWDKPKGRPGTGLVSGVPEQAHIGDRAFLVEVVDGHELRVSAGSFFQSGVQAAELLVDAVRRAAPELATASHAVDAYGGVGLFAATVMADAGRVTLIESSKSACFDAEHNLAHRDARVVRREVGGWSTDEAVDVVVADPARPGLGKPGVAALTAVAPAPIVLVSCDPVSLARDVTLLAAAGYHPARVEVLDLFPQTHHVETVTRFDKVVPGTTLS
ncbi:MAG: class I SAM-dependent RNA methyltransferase [Ilumatobacter sp.]|nr:class I SAM-dependent RNA methyltransferase [Ilumatobacter sp.]